MVRRLPARNEQQENGETIPGRKREQDRAGSGEPATERRSAQAVNREPGAAEGGAPEGRLESRDETEAHPGGTKPKTAEGGR